MKKSMIEVAYQVLTNNDGAMPFVDLWKDVSQEMGFSQTQFEDNIAQFYTDLSLDGRFLNMSQNTWDLRSRQTYSESVMDTDSIAIDEDDDEEEESEIVEDGLDEVEKDMEEEVVNKKAEEDKKKKRTSLKSILGGDILATDFFRRQTKLLVLIMVFIIFYIHNRYASQQQQIEIDRLKKELTDIKYDALTRSSELMEKSRQSRIEDYISSKESDLQTSTNPPYLIK